MSAKNVTITVSGNVVATAGFINWIQGSGTTYTVSVNAQTDYITVQDDAAGGGGGTAATTTFTPAGTLAADDVQEAIEELDGDITALRGVDHLVGTATALLSGEIVAGTSPGGELGGTWASPTVDATHSGSTHAAATTTHEAASDPHTGYVLESLFDAAGDYLRGSADNTPARQAASAATPAAISTSGATGTAGNPPSADDHVHAHEAAHINHDTTWAAKGDLIVGTANDTSAILSKGTDTHVLTADSGESTGLKWAAAGSGAVATDVIWDAKGDLAVGTGADTAAKLTVGSNGKTMMADSSQSTGIQWIADAHPGNRGAMLSGAISETIARDRISNVAFGTTLGALKLCLIWLPVCTVTSLTFVSGSTALTAGATTNHLWAALYQSDLTFLKQSTDDTSPTWSSQTSKTFTLSSSQAITVSGLYYIGVMFNATGGAPVAPSLSATGTISQVVPVTTTPVVCGNSTTALGASAPAPAGAITQGTAALYGYVS